MVKPITTRGGARLGAGRKPLPERDRLIKAGAAFTPRQTEYIERFSAREGVTFSEGLRLLVQWAIEHK
jgi:hypothetical protein